LNKDLNNNNNDNNNPTRSNQRRVNHKWLKSTDLKAETEGLLIAAQDQSMATRSYQYRIMKNEVNPVSRVRNHYEETTEHIICGCPELAKSEYIHRHNNAATCIHWKIGNTNSIGKDNKSIIELLTHTKWIPTCDPRLSILFSLFKPLHVFCLAKCCGFYKKIIIRDFPVLHLTVWISRKIEIHC